MRPGDFFTIDAHCHIYPEKIAAAAVRHTSDFYSEGSVGSGTVEDLLKRRSCGIHMFLVQSVATVPRQVASINRFISAEVAAHPDVLRGLGTMHPDCPDLEEQFVRLKELGLHGIKLHPDMQLFALDDKKCWPMYELAQDMELPMLIHTGDSRYHYSNPENLIPVLENFPRLPIVGAHMAGWSLWDDAWKSLAGKYDNLYVDCSSSFHYLNPADAERIIRIFGTDRVLFGTDYPMWDASDELPYLLQLNFAEEEFRRILSENAIRVYNLSVSSI